MAMQSAGRRARWTVRKTFLTGLAGMLLAGLLPVRLPAREKPRIQAEDYSIEATVSPLTHKLTARAVVKFVALDDISIASFELHNALRVTQVTDQAGNVLPAERVSQDSTVRVLLPNGMSKGQEATLTFNYEGNVTSADDSPVPGLRLAYVGDPISYLLYSGRWFPVTNFGIDRFTARVKINVPAGYTVVSSGNVAAAESAAAPPVAEAAAKASDESAEPTPKLPRRGGTGRKAKPAADKSAGAQSRSPSAAQSAAQSATPSADQPQGGAKPEAQTDAGMKTFRFSWSKPGFPGTVVVGKFSDTAVSEAGMTVHVYFLPDRANLAQQYGELAAKELGFFVTVYGVPTSQELKLVELPDDSVPTTWAPEIAGLAARNINPKVNYRLLANAIAHQWFGTMVSPATRNDWWIQDGGARYSESRYIEYAAGAAGAQEAVKDMAVGALAYDSVPLGQIGTLDTFDPVFQSMASDKGGMLYHMLRWVMGDQKFDRAMRTLFQNYEGKAVAVKELQKVTEGIQGEPLTWFYSQWLDSTGAPEFKDKYTVFRIKSGFRVVGQIQQDLDLFRMPVQLKIDTDGKSEEKIIDVVGTDSSYTVETFGKPREITLDPENRVLKNSVELRLRTAILRGQQLVQQGNLAESLKEFQHAIEQNKNSSLAHYRIAEVFYLQKNYQAAANSYRDSLNGDGEPKWTEVWSHVQLGKIFDICGQRERALSEYRQALQTNDNTQAALDEARQYVAKPFERSDQ
ncbi:MAG: M1 family aminopeptidase [Candidatus Korobacteraceae bacterium]